MAGRLFHAIVVFGTALAAGCGSSDTNEPITDAKTVDSFGGIAADTTVIDTRADDTKPADTTVGDTRSDTFPGIMPAKTDSFPGIMPPPPPDGFPPIA